MVMHGRRYQGDIPLRERQEGIAGHSRAFALQHTVQFPRVVPVQLGFQPGVYTLVDEKERVVLRFWQRIWHDDIFHVLKF